MGGEGQYIKFILPTPHWHMYNDIYYKEIKIKCETNNMSNWAQKLEDRLYISSVLWLIPCFGFFHGVHRLMDERTPWWYESTTDASQVWFQGLMTTLRLGWGLKCGFCQFFISNRIVPNRFVDVDFLNSRRCCLVKVLYSFDSQIQCLV